MNDLSSPTAARWLTPRSTLATALVGSVGAWLAFPPVGWSLLAWVAPVAWLLLVRLEQLPGRRPYRALWLAGFVFWLLAVHWIRLPHPLNYLAWVVLAAYLGVYLPTFVALSRVGVHRWGLPLWLVAPVVWTGLDWVRGHLLTGFGMGSLAHTQVGFPSVIQIADLVGEYGVTFLIVLVAASLTNFVAFVFSSSNPPSPHPRPFRPLLYLLPGAIALIMAIFYGFLRTAVSVAKPQANVRIALIQGNTLADWKSDPEKQNHIMQEHVQLSLDAVKQQQDIDLVVWPETAFRQTLVTVEDGYRPPPERVHKSMLTAAQKDLAELVRQLGTPVLVGIDRMHLFPDASGQLDHETYNSSVLVDAEGNIVGTYDKMHRVPFGEYIPFAEWFPALYRLTPLTGGIEPGETVELLQVDNFFIAVNICYESAVPHLIRHQVETLEGRFSVRPDLFVNLTNDAWYWGSSELDMHLACGVFRAVEMRTPMLVAANGGLSAHIDRCGRIQQISGRQQTDTLIVDLSRPPYHSSLLPSDWLAVMCLLCCIALAASPRNAAL